MERVDEPSGAPDFGVLEEALERVEVEPVPTFNSPEDATLARVEAPAQPDSTEEAFAANEREILPHPATQTRPLQELRARLNVFVSDELLALSMTHPSAVGEGLERTLKSNQRLEFLGDSLVGAICAEYFFQTEPQSPEGILTNRKISAVRKDALASAAKRLELGGFLRFGRGEDVAGGRERHSNLSDAFEALIAAIFLSNDWNTTRDWVLKSLEPELTKDPATLVPAKNRLQERTQAMGLGIPRYVTTQAHPKAQWFFAKVYLADDLRGEGEGKSKKVAEENAAAKALEWLNQNESPANESPANEPDASATGSHSSVDIIAELRSPAVVV